MPTWLERIQILHGRNNTREQEVVVTTRLGAYGLLAIQDGSARVQFAEHGPQRHQSPTILWLFPDDIATLHIAGGSRYSYIKFDIVDQPLEHFAAISPARRHAPPSQHQPLPEAVWGWRPERCWPAPLVAQALPDLLLVGVDWWPDMSARREAEARLALVVARYLRHHAHARHHPHGLRLSQASAGQSELDRVVALIRRWPDRRWQVPDMAAEAGISQRQLSRRCLAAYGLGPGELIRQARLHAAADMLGQGQSITFAAEHCGYSDPTSLSRAFRRQFGCAPQQWRRRR